MAKRYGSRSGSRSAGMYGKSRGRKAGGSVRRRTGSGRGGQQTLRIVLEQPGASGSVAFGQTLSARPKKARF